MLASERDISQISQVSLSSNGQIMAAVDAKTLTVRVYDNDGANWVMRGSSLISMKYLHTDSIVIASHEACINTAKSNLSPTTVAVKKDEQVYIFDWNQDQWEERSLNLRGKKAPVREALTKLKY